ncbi:hypothetical protein FBQ82_05330 [Anaerolineae bacterium CFX7]|nr:hypothetical protein [Anaerolineae bacterium CFX7]
MASGEAFAALLFFCVFEVLGGGAVGTFVRSLLRREPAGVASFFLIWGAGFGGIPLFVGGALLLTSERPILFFVQAFVFVMAIVLVALMPPDLFDQDAGNSVPKALVGAILCMFGAALVLLTLQDGVGVVTLVGAALAFGGAALLGRATLGLFHST